MSNENNELEVHPSDKYRPEFCQDVIVHMSTGKSLTSFIAYLYKKYGLMITRKTINNWMDRKPEFADAVEIAKAQALDFLENMLTSDVTGVLPKSLKKQGSKGVGQKSLHFTLGSRFHEEYGLRQRIDHEVKQETIQINIDADDADL